MSPRPITSGPDPLADARSALMDAIRQLPLESHFSRSTVKSAQELASADRRWRGPLAWYRPEGSHADALQCETLEPPGNPRLVTVYLYLLFGKMAVESSCGCGRPLCAHAAALLIRLQRLVEWPRLMTPLQRWHSCLARPRESRPQAAAAKDPQSSRVICLLQPAGHHQPATLLARLALIEPQSGPQRSDRWPSVEELPAEAVSPQILLWQTRLAREPRHSRASGAWYELRGPGTAALMAQWLRAGICHHAETLQQICPGVARQPRWEWCHDAQARACLTVNLADDGSVRMVELQGLHYLDEASGEFGALLLQPDTWSIIEQMPPIAPQESGLLRAWPPHPLLAGIPPPPPPPSLRPIRAALEPILVIGAARRGEHADHVFYVHAWADYQGYRLPLAQEPWREQVICRMREEFAAVQREVERELTARQQLAGAAIVELRKLITEGLRTLAPVPAPGALAHCQHYRGGADTFTALESSLGCLRSLGFRVEYDPELPFSVLPMETPLHASLHESESAGWTQFQLSAICGEDEIDVLPVILTGLRRREFSLTPEADEPADAHWLAPLGSQRFLPLPLARLRDWLTPLLNYVGRPGTEGAALELPDAQAMSLSDSLQRHNVAVDGGRALSIAETLAALRAAQKSGGEPPGSFRGTLRHYQVEGLHWLQALRQARMGGVLADDMGLGKTVQIIAHLLLEQEAGRLDRPALIVASTTLVFNWLDEIARFAPSLTCINFTGSARAQLREKLATAHVIIVSYALLVNELPALSNLDYSMLVLDEAQWIKNPLAQAARAARVLRAPHKLVVTGTPLENHLGEIWTHMDVVMPGYLGNHRAFSQSFRTPIERNQDDRRLLALRRLIAPFVLRRTKAEVAPELPAKTETVLRVVMSEGQRRLYESVRLALSREVRAAMAQYSQEQSHMVVLSALLRLRQVCCDPRLIEPDAGQGARSAKLDALLQLIRSLREQGRQVLVFSQFTSMLELISQALRAAGLEHLMLTGKSADRRRPVQRFQSGEVQILLASLKAGGVGLNLTAADAVIHYDPWWNPAAESQAADRAHRLGREGPVFIYKLLCEDTIEDKIAAMQDLKSDLAHAVLGDGRPRGGALSDAEVRTLFEIP